MDTLPCHQKVTSARYAANPYHNAVSSPLHLCHPDNKDTPLPLPPGSHWSLDYSFIITGTDGAQISSYLAG